MHKFLKITLWTVGIILLLLLGGVVYLNSPFGQNFVRARLESYLKGKLKTEVRIGALGYGLPKFIVLKDVLFLDQSHDTLLAAKLLKVDIAMLRLLHKEISVQEVTLSGIHSHIHRNLPDTTFNFTYIINAFAGKPKAPKTTPKTDKPSASFKIELDKVKLDDIHFRFDDITGGTAFAANLNHLDLRLKDIDLDALSFHVKELDISGLQSTFNQDTSYLPKHPKDTSTTQFKLIADNVHLEQVKFNYGDKQNNLLFGIELGDLALQLKQFDLAKNTVDITKIVINNTTSVLLMGKHNVIAAIADTLANAVQTNGWHISGKDIQLNGIAFRMDNENAQRLKKGIDYNYLNLTDVAFHGNDIIYSNDSATGLIKHVALKEQCGLVVEELQTRFRYSDQGVNLTNLYLLTPHTVVRKNVEVRYPSVSSIAKNLDSLEIHSDIINSVLGIQDLVLFAPTIIDLDFIRKFPKAQIRFDAKVNGYLNNLFISHVYALLMNGTELDVKGRLSGLPNPDKLNYNLNIAKLNSSRVAVGDFVPDSLLQSVRLPDRFSVAGNVAGTMKDYRTDLSISSTDGSAYVKGYVFMSPGSGHEKYDMLVQTHELNLGRILKQDSVMGKVSAAITAKGSGFDPKTISADINGAIGTAYLNKYNYHDIIFSSKLNKGKGSINLSAADSNLRVKLDGTADFRGEFAAIKADILLDSIDFKALKLYGSELRASGIIHADFPVLNPDYPEGNFSWIHPIVNADGKRFLLDSLFITSKPNAQTGQDITADFDVLKAHITGKTPLTKIGAIVMDHINRHNALGLHDTGKSGLLALKNGKAPTQKKPDTVTIPADYGLNFTASIIDKPLLRGLLPGLTSFETVTATGELTPRTMSFSATIPEVVYGSNVLRNGLAKLNGTDSAFTYQITADKFANSALDLWYANVNGNIDGGKITTNISLSDSLKKERFTLAANILSVGDSTIIQLQRGLKLNYNSWEVSPGNSIVMTSKGYYVNDFSINYGGQYIKAKSDQPSPLAPLKLDITNFLLSNITGISGSGDSLLANGVLGASFTIQKSGNAMQVSGDMVVLDLSVMGDTLGKLEAKLSVKDENTVTTDLTLTGHENDIHLAGSYYLTPRGANDFDLKLDIKALALKSFEGLAQKQIKNSSGFIRGKFDVTGKITAPLITGELRTDNLRTNIVTINSIFKLESEKVQFSGHTISFNSFTILDSPDNRAVVNGTINTTDLLNPAFDLNIKAKNWRAIHSTVKDNSIFYGDLFVTTNLNVKGTVSAPVADGSLNVLKGTNLTVVTPESQPELESSKGIVAFINMRDTGRSRRLAVRKKVPQARKKISGPDVNVNITIDKSAKFSLVIDQASGDFISMQGDAYLNASFAPNGTIGLNGNYELHQGVYQLNYNFVKRKFLIKDGSNITFAGDPLTGANLDITAAYETMAPPYDLVQRQVDQSQLNYYKQRLPFEVELYLKGKILKPSISFDIKLPENKVYPLNTEQIDLIQSKLGQVRTDTSELNKQVFAMLILNRFVADDPFSSGASSSAAFTAMQSASTFIGEQLNKAAGHFVKGVDFSVDLATTEDYTTGDMRQRTDLNLAASKQLMNDRLKLTIGNDFELSGQQSSNQQSSYVPTNLAADYLLSADGKYSLKAYRRAYDEGVLQGYVTETGLNFIVNLEYNKFKNILKNNKRQKQASKNDTLKSN